jgi:hypothetical protein
MNDIVNLRLSKEANDVAERLVATGKFENVITAAKFALAYALKNHFEEFNPENYVVSDSGGNNYNIGTVDKDGTLSALLRAIYPDTTTPYIYARALMVFGLLKIGERIETEGMPTVSALCE